MGTFSGKKKKHFRRWFLSVQEHILALTAVTASAAVERGFSFFGNKFDDQNLANAQIKGGLHLKPPCCCTTINAPLHNSSSSDLLSIYSDWLFLFENQRICKNVYIFYALVSVYMLKLPLTNYFFVSCVLRSWYDICFLSLRSSIIRA